MQDATSVTTRERAPHRKVHFLEVVHSLLTVRATTAIAGTLAMSGFLAFLLIQHRVVFPYYDDYGLATLDIS